MGERGALTLIVPTPLCLSRAVITLTFSSGSEAPPQTTLTAPNVNVTIFGPRTVTLVTRTRWSDESDRRTAVAARMDSLLDGLSCVLIRGTPFGASLTIA